MYEAIRKAREGHMKYCVFKLKHETTRPKGPKYWWYHGSVRWTHGFYRWTHGFSEIYRWTHGFVGPWFFGRPVGRPKIWGFWDLEYRVHKKQQQRSIIWEQRWLFGRQKRWFFNEFIWANLFVSKIIQRQSQDHGTTLLKSKPWVHHLWTITWIQRENTPPCFRMSKNKGGIFPKMFNTPKFSACGGL